MSLVAIGDALLNILYASSNFCLALPLVEGTLLTLAWYHPPDLGRGGEGVKTTLMVEWIFFPQDFQPSWVEVIFFLQDFQPLWVEVIFFGPGLSTYMGRLMIDTELGLCIKYTGIFFYRLLMRHSATLSSPRFLWCCCWWHLTHFPMLTMVVVMVVVL